MNGIEQTNKEVLRGHDSRRRALLGGEVLVKKLIPIPEQRAIPTQQSTPETVQELGASVTKRVLIPPTVPTPPPANFIG